MFDVIYEELKNANTKSALKFYWSCSKGFRWLYAYDIFYSFLLSLTKIISVLLFAKLISYLSSLSLNNFLWSDALFYIVLILGVFCLTHINRYFREIVSEKGRSMLSWKARAYALDYVSRYSLSYIKEQKSGVIAQRIRALGDNMWGMRLSVNRIISCFWLLILPLLFIGNKNVIFMIIVITFGMISAIFSFLVSKKSASLNNRTEEKVSKYNGYVADSLTNILLIKMFGEENSEIKKLNNELKILNLFQTKTIFSENLIYAVQDFFITLFRITCVIFGLYLWKINKINVADVIALFLLIDDVLPIFYRFMVDITLIRNNIAKLSDSLKIIQVPIDIKNKTNAKNLDIKSGDIEFKDICFGYDNKLIFENFNLKIKAKEKIGIVGKSGSGKSTLISLLQRNYDLNSGKITIDGKDISKVTLNSLKRNIAIINQDNVLFHRTIKKNISYSKPNISNKKIVKAATLACANEFILDTPHGYNTITGERGIKLSGGQRQRIAIARAILKNAPILILDEATSALDNKTENDVINAIDNLMKNKTVITIAHRVSTLKNMDRIIVINNGKIIEEGTPKELIDKKGEFQKLWNLQK